MAFKFDQEKIKERIKFENPWWEDGKIDPRFSKMKRREYFNPFYKLVEEKEPKRAVVLMGPRRVGKTVMIHHSIQQLIKTKTPKENICFISLDTPIYDGSLLNDLLHMFMEIHKHKKTNSLYVFFDEIQYLKNWEVHLKSLVDSYHHIKFVVSGSAAAALKLKSNESGAGRFTDFILPPLTFKEYLHITGKETENLIKLNFKEHEPGKKIIEIQNYNIKLLNKEFLNYINFGGYPEVSLSSEIQKNTQRYVLSDIIEKVLLKDIPTLYGIEDIQELKSFFNYIAYHTGQEFSAESLANKSGVAKNTIKKYIEYLEASFLIKKLNKIDQNAKMFKRETKFKLYLTNPSLRSALFSPIDFEDPLFGHVAETTAYAQLLHFNTNNLYYARWDKGEIDFVTLTSLQKADTVLEIKWSNKPTQDFKRIHELLSFSRKNNVRRITITTIDKYETPRIEGTRVEFIPLALHCYTLSKWRHDLSNQNATWD